MADGFFSKIKGLFPEPDTIEGIQAESDSSTKIGELNYEALHAFLRDPDNVFVRERYFQEDPKACLRYYRREPGDLRDHLKKRLQTDHEFKRWIGKAGYDLDDPCLDPIVLGLMWNPDEKNSLGNVEKEGHVGEPFVVSRDLMKEGHVHVRGRTRSGKSALAITPLLQQLIRPYSVANKDGTIIEGFRDAIFVIDLGGDLALFNFAKKMADEKHHNRKFRFLSLESKEAWDYFDPFQAAGHEDDRIIRIAILLQKAFSLDHGLAYAASYFSSRNLSSLLEVARKLTSQHKEGRANLTLRDVSRHLEEANVKDADEIRMIFQFLTEYEQLEPFGPYDTPNPQRKDLINLERSLEDGEVVYFFLPTLSESMTGRQIAGLALYTLISAAQRRVRKPQYQGGKPLPHAWVFVDEFQQLAGSSYADVLAQASKFGLSLIMANQTTTQLDVRDLNLADIVRDNTFCKIYFTITGEQDIKALKSFSKEDRDTLVNVSAAGFDTRASQQEYLTTVLRTDEILDTSSTNQHAYILLDDGTGHREPVRLWMDYAMSLEDFRELKTTPPKPFDGVRPKIEVPDEGEPLWKIARKKVDSPQWQKPLSNLFKQKVQEEYFG